MMDEKQSDRELALQAGKGDQAAFEDLFRGYHERLFSVVYRFARDAAWAEELTQQIWVKVWQKLPKYRGDSAFFTWLYRVASFHCLDEIRKRKRKAEMEWNEEWEGHQVVSEQTGRDRPDAIMDRSELQEAFTGALNQLNPVHRMTLVLREVEGMSYEDIAVVMKCRKGTVMSRLHYARREVQKTLETWR